MLAWPPATPPRPLVTQALSPCYPMECTKSTTTTFTAVDTVAAMHEMEIEQEARGERGGSNCVFA